MMYSLVASLHNAKVVGEIVLLARGVSDSPSMSDSFPGRVRKWTNHLILVQGVSKASRSRISLYADRTRIRNPP